MQMYMYIHVTTCTCVDVHVYNYMQMYMYIHATTCTCVDVHVSADQGYLNTRIPDFKFITRIQNHYPRLLPCPTTWTLYLYTPTNQF